MIRIGTLFDLVDIAKISTCISNAADNKNTSEFIVQLKDNLMLKGSYEFTRVDYRLVGPSTGLNETVNSIEFALVKGDKKLYEIRIDDTKQKASPDSLCSTELPLDTKITWLRSLKPKTLDQLKFFKVSLTPEEIQAINQKAEELRNELNEMLKPKSGRIK